MLRKLAVASLLYVVPLFVVAVVLQSGSALAQSKKDKGPAERTVSGVISTEDGKAVAGAVVQLKNTKTLQIRSFISKDNGEYFFNGLGTDVDFEITAKSGEMVSPKRVLSSFDSRKAAILNITVK